MKDIVKFCGRTIEETAKRIDETQIKLEQILDKGVYDAIPTPFKRESNQENFTTT